MSTTWKAPGKLILFGEHSVVYGKHAVAAALSLSTFATARLIRRKDDDSLKVILHTDPRRKQQSGSEEDKMKDEERLKSAMCAIAHDVDASIKGSLELWMQSTVPEGAGLGSSAALSVACAASIHDVLKGYMCIQPSEWRERVNHAAFAGEKMFHDNPSGVDNTVSTYGGAVLFAKGTPPKHFSIASSSTSRGIRVLIVDSGVPRSTRDAIAAVRERITADKPRLEAAFQRMDAIALEAFELLQGRPVDMAKLDTLVDENHRILCDVLGVGHPAIDKAVKLCADSGIHAKITGAGCGGCIFGFISDRFPSRELSNLIAKLKAEGMNSYVADLGAAGVCQQPTEPPEQ